jgi:hypothetical protein
MIEQGLVMLIQGTPAVVAISPAGGFLGTLPPNKPLPSWTFATVSNPTDYTLQGAVGLGMGRYQIDCYGATGADAIRLAKAIDDVLSGFLGVLTDPDATPVQGCFRSNMLDFFDEEARDFRRMLEYEIWYVTS